MVLRKSGGNTSEQRAGSLLSSLIIYMGQYSLNFILFTFSLLILSNGPLGAATYYLTSAGAGSAQNLGSWNTSTSGTGSAPTSFARNGDSFVIPSGINGTVSGIWNFGGGTNADNTVTLTIDGKLTISSSYYLNLNTKNNDINTITVNGILVLAATSSTQIRGTLSGSATAANNSLIFTSGSTLQTVNTRGITGSSGSVNLSQVTLTFNAGTNFEFSGTSQSLTGMPSAVRNLTFSGSGTKTLSAAVSVNGTLTISSGVTFATADLGLTLSGDMKNNGTINAGSSSVIVTGTAALQTLSGFTTTGSLTFSKSSGSVVVSGNVTCTTLVLTGGSVSTGTAVVTVTGSITGGSDASFVSGRLARRIASAGTYLFPVGKGDNYREVSIQCLSVSGTGTITVEQFEQSIPGTVPSSVIPFTTRYWSIAQSGAQAFEYKITLDGSGFMTSGTTSAVILKGDGTRNTTVSATVSDQQFTSTNKLTSTGLFTVGESGQSWIGKSSDWFSTANWSDGLVPDGTGSIFIPAQAANYPVISGSSSSKNITLQSGAYLNLQDGATVTVSAGLVLTINAGATVNTPGLSRLVIESGASYINLGTSDPRLEIRRTLPSGSAKGWKMLSSPVSTTYSDIFKAPVVTQGFPGSGYPDLQPNLLFWAENDGGSALQSWRKPVSINDAVTGGRGYFIYLFNGAPLPAPLSGSYSDTYPLTMSATGTEFSAGTGSFSYSITNTARKASSTTTYTEQVAEGWNLIGNPTASTLDWDAASGWKKSNIDNVIYIWDDTAAGGMGTYRYWTGDPEISTLSDGRIAPFQAFWIHANASSPLLSFDNSVKTSKAGTLVAKSATNELQPATVTSSETPGMILKLEAVSGPMKTAASVRFSENGITGCDPDDVYRLEPMNNTWLALYTNSSASLKDPLIVNNLPLDTSLTQVIPLYISSVIDGVPAGGRVKLQWALPEYWSQDISVTLMDHTNQKAIPMTSVNEYEYDLTPVKSGKALSVNPLDTPGELIRSVGNDADAKGASTVATPFSIVIKKASPGIEQAYERLQAELLSPAPNPFREHTIISFRLPESADVRIEAFDLTGRLLETVADSNFGAGLNQADWYPETNFTGMCIIRFVSGTSVQTVKAIRIR